MTALARQMFDDDPIETYLQSPKLWFVEAVYFNRWVRSERSFPSFQEARRQAFALHRRRQFRVICVCCP